MLDVNIIKRLIYFGQTERALGAIAIVPEDGELDRIGKETFLFLKRTSPDSIETFFSGDEDDLAQLFDRYEE